MPRALIRALPLLALAACVGLPPAPPPTRPIRLLSINDVYVLDTLADGRGGLARVATVRNRLRAQGPLLFVMAGDFLSPSLLSKYYRGAQMIEALNAAKLDYATFGNHEFELDRDTLVARIRASSFKWLSANCTEADGRPFPGVLPWDTVRVEGQLVGLFSVTLPGSYRRYVRCANPDSAARVAVAALDSAKAELIIGLTHQTAQADLQLLARDGRIDALLGGHEHSAIDTTASGRHLLKADANSRSAQFLTVWGAKGRWRQASRRLEMRDDIPFDTAVSAVATRWRDSLRTRLGPPRAVGTATAPLDARDELQRRAQSPLGSLVTDAMRAGTGADVALINAGAMRLDDVIPAGPVSSYDLESIFLFADETRVVAFELTGARLRALLEHGVGEGQLGKGAYPQVSGVGFRFDPRRPSGSRIVGDLTRPDGGVLGPDARVRVAFVTYPACEGGDGYEVPEATAACAGPPGPRTVDLLTRHIEGTLGGRIVPGSEPRVTDVSRRAGG